MKNFNDEKKVTKRRICSREKQTKWNRLSSRIPTAQHCHGSDGWKLMNAVNWSGILVNSIKQYYFILTILWPDVKLYVHLPKRVARKYQFAESYVFFSTVLWTW